MQMSIKFEIYRDGARLTQFAPVAPMAMGPESVPLASEISFREGLLTINRTDEHALGIAPSVGCPGVGSSFHSGNHPSCSIATGPIT